MRGTGLADWFGVSPVAVFRRHCGRHLVVCAPVVGAIEGAVFRHYLLVAGAVSSPFAAPFQAHFIHQIRSFNKGEI